MAGAWRERLGRVAAATADKLRRQEERERCRLGCANIFKICQNLGKSFRLKKRGLYVV